MFTNQAGVLAALLSSNWCQTARTASAYSPKYSLSSAAFASSLSLSSTGRSTSAIKRCCTACISSTTSSTVTGVLVAERADGRGAIHREHAGLVDDVVARQAEGVRQAPGDREDARRAIIRAEAEKAGEARARPVRRLTGVLAGSPFDEGAFALQDLVFDHADAADVFGQVEDEHLREHHLQDLGDLLQVVGELPEAEHRRVLVDAEVCRPRSTCRRRCRGLARRTRS